MKSPDYMELSHYVRRSDGKPLTPEDVGEVDALLGLMVQFCEARGLLLDGVTAPKSEEDGEGEDLRVSFPQGVTLRNRAEIKAYFSRLQFEAEEEKASASEDLPDAGRPAGEEGPAQ